MSLPDWAARNIVQPIVEGVIAGIVHEITKESDRVIATTTSNVTGSIAELGNSLTANINSVVTNVIQGIKSLNPFGNLFGGNK